MQRKRSSLRRTCQIGLIEKLRATNRCRPASFSALMHRSTTTGNAGRVVLLAWPTSGTLGHHPPGYFHEQLCTCLGRVLCRRLGNVGLFCLALAARAERKRALFP